MTISMPRYCERSVPELLPTTAELLVQGGDARIELDAKGLNKYGCRPTPDSGLLAFGSSTSSDVSAAGFAAADNLRRRILLNDGAESQAAIYERELNRMRRELSGLCGVGDMDGVECVFAASGTDIHLIATQLVVANAQGDVPLVIMVDAAETGSGVPAALAGRPSNSRSTLGETVAEGAPMADEVAVEVVAVPLRQVDGNVRATAEVDAEVAALVSGAVATGRRVLLVLADVSKTGLIAPSLSCVMALHRRLAGDMEVLVDACQFRLAPATVRAYLERGFMVALTGSKFVSGPSFSGALMLPASSARRLRWRTLPHALANYSCRADWPASWASADALGYVANPGLLLRWEAALEELRQFRTLPEADITVFLQAFSDAVHGRLMRDPLFEPLSVPPLDRRALHEAAHWDRLQTIFPFLLYRPTADGREALSTQETREIYRLLQADVSGMFEAAAPDDLPGLRCQLGQPVSCGYRDGVPVTALRLCVSARLVVEAIQGREQAAQVISQALAALDKTAMLVAAVRGGR
ncbi:MAG: hypothetical protein GC139_01135 [Sideroxydans sp.]|nr:hypothetical protein [Sideroxydans sp.]